ncbi:hypothetical protein AVEN_252835-1 [Araneus ventricosus]|uniref:RNase H type-1 domain-containing protein n=1 Tax=Araneus ventricosus TaxID=182803 RepID=A0A4Y2CMG3_ARAVE|nr:hypothetical protein AVEN_252835-1 [Araneus ventricosus]
MGSVASDTTPTLKLRMEKNFSGAAERSKYRIHLQWISSHVNIQGNEIADALAKAGADDASVPSAPLTYLELFSRAQSRNKTIWLIPPVHHWYRGSRPGGCLSIDCNRRKQTALTRFLSGHYQKLDFL